MPKLTSGGRSALGVRPGDRIDFVETEEGQLVITAATGSVRELKGMLRSRRSKTVSIKDMNAAIARGASKLR
jgi:antitoxin PrlF